MAKTEYTRMLTGFRGIDVANDDSNVDPTRFPYIVNMWRDFKSENGAAVETFPGWRLVNWTAGTGEIHGIYGAKFYEEGSTVDYVILHQGTKLYAARSDERDTEKTLGEIATVKDGDSKGFQFGTAFYLLDGDTIWRITKADGFSCIEIGEDAYIPITYSDGLEYEQRNMLTNIFRHQWTVGSTEETTLPDNGLLYTVLSESEKTAAVTGVYAEARHIYIPAMIVIDKKEYTVVQINDKAFAGSAIQSVIAADTVKTIGSGTTETSGAFYSCTSLSYAVLHGAESLGAGAFASCPNLSRLVLADTLKTIGTNALSIGTGMLYLYFEGTNEEATTLGLSSANNGSCVVYSDIQLTFTSSGNTVEIPYTLEQSATAELVNLRGGIGLEGAYDVKKAVTDQGLIFAVTLQDAVAMLLLEISGADHFAVISSEKNGNVYNRAEADSAHYRFDIYDPCKAVRSVTLDGVETSYTVGIETLNDKTYVRAIILTAKRDSLLNKKLLVEGEAYESEFCRSEAGEDYTYGNAYYSGTSAEAIKKCTVVAEYDGRIFLTGNPGLPNTVFYSNRNLLGVNDPTYFGQLNYFNDGAGLVPNISMIATPSFLGVIKKDTTGEGSIYYHTAQTTEYHVLPRIYPSTQGSADIGSLGAAINFRDDPVFLSKDGIEGISLAGVNAERGLYHRSTNIDRMLLENITQSSAEMTVWEGYLVILAGGKLFLADSRQMSEVAGSHQYEWYVIDDAGYYEGQRTLYYFPSASPYDSDGNRLTDLWLNGKPLEVKSKESFFTEEASFDIPTYDIEGAEPTADKVAYTTEYDEENEAHYYILSTYGEQFEGDFSPAVKLLSLSDILYLGTKSGRLLCVNTDKRGIAVTEEVPIDRIHPEFYTRCGRRYRSGCATKKDNCDVPWYDKDTVRLSLVVKAKTMPHSKFSIKLRTDRQDWEFIQDATATEVNLYDMEFDNAALFNLGENIQQLRDTSRRWVEKQYFLYSDEYKRPFGLYSIAYRYVISGLTGRIRR